MSLPGVPRSSHSLTGAWRGTTRLSLTGARFGLLTSEHVKDVFYKFLEVLAEMFSFKAQDRPTFAVIHNSNVIQKLAWDVHVQEREAHAKIVDKVQQEVAQLDGAIDLSEASIMVETLRHERPYLGIGDTTRTMQESVSGFTQQSVKQSFISGRVEDVDDGQDVASTFTKRCEGLCGFERDPVELGPYVVFNVRGMGHELEDECMGLCQQDFGCRNFAITPEDMRCFLFTISDPQYLAGEDHMIQYKMQVSKDNENGRKQLIKDQQGLTKCGKTTKMSICYQRD